MKKVMFIFLAAASSMCFPVSAEPVNYADKYISFTYDDSINQTFDFRNVTYEDEARAYFYLDTKLLKSQEETGYARLDIEIKDVKDKDEYLNSFFSLNGMADDSLTEKISDTEMVLHSRGIIPIVSYQKLVASYGDQYITASCYTTDTECSLFKYCKAVYDTIIATDLFREEGIPYNEDHYYDLENCTICHNVLYSKKLRDYIRQGIIVCEDYLVGDISVSSAKSKIKDLTAAIEENFSDSEYLSDISSVYAFPSETLMDLSNPEIYVIESKQELEDILEAIDSQYE